MTDCQREETRAFLVSVTFLSGGDAFAVQTYRVDAANSFDAERLARDEAWESVYCDPRIPEFALDVDVTPTDPEDDPPPPPASTAAAGRNRPVS